MRKLMAQKHRKPRCWQFFTGFSRISGAEIGSVHRSPATSVFEEFSPPFAKDNQLDLNLLICKGAQKLACLPTVTVSSFSPKRAAQ